LNQYLNAFEVGDNVRFLAWGFDRNGNPYSDGTIVEVDRARQRVKVEEAGGPRDGNSRWYGMKLFTPRTEEAYGQA
jgi:hypothetical protein